VVTIQDRSGWGLGNGSSHDDRVCLSGRIQIGYVFVLDRRLFRYSNFVEFLCGWVEGRKRSGWDDDRRAAYGG
jgi:hypothetical protein